MNAKPMSNEVEVSLSNGFWFFFEVEGHQVSVHNSAWTGRERIWVDDEEVANHLSWSKYSEHEIEIDGRVVTVGIAVPSWTAGKVICTLSRDGKEIVRIEKQLRPSKKVSPWTLALSVLIGMAAGYIAARGGIALFSTLTGAG